MRKAFVLMLCCLTGCGVFRGPRMGWRFEVIRPPSVSTDSLIVEGAPSLSTVGLGSHQAEGTPLRFRQQLLEREDSFSLPDFEARLRNLELRLQPERLMPPAGRPSVGTSSAPAPRCP